MNQFSFSCHADTWEYDIESNEWDQIDTEIHPEARMFHSMVYHSAESKVILFGGNEDPYTTLYNDIWIFNTENNEWSEAELSTEETAIYLIGAIFVLVILSWSNLLRKKKRD